jgi:hypothetical protein
MSWRIIGKPFTTADMSGAPTISQRITLDNKTQLKSAVCGIIQYGNPSFTSIFLSVYSDNAGAPGLLIKSSDVILNSSLSTLDHAYKQVGFVFTNPPTLAAGVVYHFVISAVGYTGNDSSHLAWRHSYPDPQYQTGVTIDAANAAKHPFEISIIGAEIK